MDKEGQKIYSVLEINQALRAVLRSSFPASFWVWGEVQDLRLNSSRHSIYFSLVQKHASADEVAARIRAVIYENIKRRIEASLEEGGVFPGRHTEAIKDFLQEGREIKILCRLNLYPRSGNYYLEVLTLDPAYTLGRLARRRQELWEELKKKGLLDKNKTILLSPVPLNIGLITAYNSAAFFDFVSEIKSFGYSFKIFVLDAHMQGSLTEKEVSEGISFFNRRLPSLDAIVITRGGGALADLSWFDSRRIVEAVALSRIPVLSALGHEINITLTDAASHLHFKTPTKVAQFLGERVEEFLSQVEQKGEAIARQSQHLIQHQSLRLETGAGRIVSEAEKYILKERERLALMQASLRSTSRNIIGRSKSDIRHLLSRIASGALLALQRERIRLDSLRQKADVLHPRHTLRRGFSITLAEGRPLKDAGQLKKGDYIETVMFRGRAKSLVMGIKTGEE